MIKPDDPGKRRGPAPSHLRPELLDRRPCPMCSCNAVLRPTLALRARPLAKPPAGGSPRPQSTACP